MKQCARVVAVDGDTARVLPDGSRCPGCAGGHCKWSLRTVTVANPLGLSLRVADNVEVSSSTIRGLLELTLLILFPAVSAGAAVWSGLRLFGDLTGPQLSLCALLGSAVGVAMLVALGPRRRMRTLPRVSAVLSNQEAVGSVSAGGNSGGSGGPGRIVSSKSNS